MKIKTASLTGATPEQQALVEYNNLPEVAQDESSWDGTVDHLVYRAQHEIDLVEEGERKDYPMRKADERKIRAFVKKWSTARTAT